MKRVTILTVFISVFVLTLNAQNDTIYVMKNGAIIYKQSIKQVNVDSLKFNIADSMSFVKNNIILKKLSIKTTDVDSVIFYKPILSGSTTITDYDGNVYNTVTIGSQVWMKENLKTTHYANGTAIPFVKGNSNWDTLKTTSKAYCWYNDDTVNKVIYGALYTWAAAMNGTSSSFNNPSGVQGVCPTGWHLPSNAEWTQMENYLADNGYNYDGTTGGGRNKIAKSLASTNGWTSSSITGAVGNTDYPAYRNKSGFTALPGGYRNNDGTFREISNNGYWWSTTNSGSIDAWYRYMSYYDASFGSWDIGTMNIGISVRCLRD